jgi:hypothetical protein
LNRRLLRRFPYTSATLGMTFLVLALAVVWHINVLDVPGVSVIGLEETEIGEIGIALLLVIPAFFVDRVVASQRAHEAHVQAEQLRVLKVTMRTVQDIVNNNLNQLQLLRLEADGHVAEDTLRLFDATIRDTTAQLTALGNMQIFAEKPMASGSWLDVSEGR